MEDQLYKSARKFKENSFNLFLKEVCLRVIIWLNEAEFSILLMFSTSNKDLHQFGDFVLMESDFHIFGLDWNIELESELLRVGAVD